MHSIDEIMCPIALLVNEFLIFFEIELLHSWFDQPQEEDFNKVNLQCITIFPWPYILIVVKITEKFLSHPILALSHWLRNICSLWISSYRSKFGMSFLPLWDRKNLLIMSVSVEGKVGKEDGELERRMGIWKGRQEEWRWEWGTRCNISGWLF